MFLLCRIFFSYLKSEKIWKCTLHTRPFATNRTMQHNTSYTRACFQRYLAYMYIRIWKGRREGREGERENMYVYVTPNIVRHNDTLRECARVYWKIGKREVKRKRKKIQIDSLKEKEKKIR